MDFLEVDFLEDLYQKDILKGRTRVEAFEDTLATRNLLLDKLRDFDLCT